MSLLFVLQKIQSSSKFKFKFNVDVFFAQSVFVAQKI